jgi:AsmA-like C-terminal region
MAALSENGRKWLKRVVLAAVGLGILAVALPYLIPLNFYIPTLERLAAERLGQPVKIESLRAMLLPFPGLQANGVRIGQADEIEIGKLRVRIAPASLFQNVRVIREIGLESVTAKQAAWPILQAQFTEKSDRKKDDEAEVRVERLILHGVRLELKAVRLPLLDAAIVLLPKSGFGGAAISSDDNKLKADVALRDGRFLISLQALDWTLPIGPALPFDVLRAQATVDSGGMQIKRLEGRLYGGSLSGSGVLDWSRDWTLKGDLAASGVQTDKLWRMFNPKTYFSGRLDAKARYDLRADSAAKLFDAPNVDASFTLNDGVLHNVDLVAASKSVGRGAVHGGQTKFDEFKGQVLIEGKRYRFRKLRITSGLVAGEGRVDLMPDNKLDGKVAVAVKGSVGILGVPLKVTGTAQDPVLFPSAGALAGAAAGSLLLGPGAGTALGTKAGEWVEKLFGGD